MDALGEEDITCGHALLQSIRSPKMSIAIDPKQRHNCKEADDGEGALPISDQLLHPSDETTQHHADDH